MRVLVVEDDKRIADGLVAHLAGHGHAVDTAGNLATGWAALCAEPFDLLLLDLGLPDGDGASLLARLRAAPAAGLPDAHTPVLVMTARDEVASRIGSGPMRRCMPPRPLAAASWPLRLADGPRAPQRPRQAA